MCIRTTCFIELQFIQNTERNTDDNNLPWSRYASSTNQRKTLSQNTHFQPQNISRNLVFATELPGVAVNVLILQTTVTSTY